MRRSSHQGALEVDTSLWYGGECLCFGDKFSRVRVLTALDGAGTRWKRKPDVSLAGIGPDQLVFWNGDHLAEDGRLVRVKIKPNELHDQSERGRATQAYRVVDWAPLGILVTEKNPSTANLQPARAGDKIYYRERNHLIGPWKKRAQEGQKLVAERGHYVLEYAMVPTDESLELDGKLYLLSEPNSKPIEVHDCANDETVLHSILKKAQGIDPLAIQQLDIKFSGWREQVLEGLRAADGTIEQRLMLFRWKRVYTILDTMKLEAEAYQALLESPAVKRLIQEAIEEAVQIRASEIERQAKQLTADLEDHAKQELALFEAEKERLQYEVLELEAQVESTRADSALLTRAAELLRTERSRFMVDYLALFGPPEAAPVPEAPLIPPAEALAPEPPPGRPTILHQSRPKLLDRALGPALAQALPGATRRMAEALLYALLSSPWTLVPSLAWVRAIARAGLAEVIVVQADPRWLTFEDAYRGDVTAAFECAAREPGQLVTLVIERLNGALLGWARPLLNTIAGIQSAPRTTIPWPSNLRLVSTLTSDSTRFPIEDPEIVTAFAGVPPTPLRDTPLVAGRVDPGGLPAPLWQGELDAMLMQDGLEEEAARAFAHKLRHEWPTAYLEALRA